MLLLCFFFFFKQKTAYEMRISDWSSDVCSSDLLDHAVEAGVGEDRPHAAPARAAQRRGEHRSRLARRQHAAIGVVVQIGRASCRARVCQYVEISVDAVSLNTKTINTSHYSRA